MASVTHTSYCCVDGCYVNTRDNVPFFRFPRDPERSQQWKTVLNFIGDHRYAKLTSEEAYCRIRVCRSHFDQQSFKPSGKRLLPTAVPSILLGSPNDTSSDTIQTATEPSEEVDALPSALPSSSDASTQSEYQEEFHQFVEESTTATEPSEEVNALPSALPLSSNASTQGEYQEEFHQFVGGNEVKRKWKNVKDCYIKHLKSLTSPPSTTSRRSYKNWQWSKQMAFYKPFIAETDESERQTDTSNAEAEDDSHIDTNNETSLPFEDVECDVSNVKLEFDDFAQYDEESHMSSNRKRSLNQPSLEEIGDFLIDKKPRFDESLDAVDMIFLGYAKTIKSFSPTRQAVVKMRIAQIIMEEELAHIKDTGDASTSGLADASAGNGSNTNVSETQLHLEPPLVSE